MLTTELFPPIAILHLLKMSDQIDGSIGEGAGRNAIGKELQQQNMSFHFTPGEQWDAGREVLTERQRIRDLEFYMFGDPRGVIVGLLRQAKSHVLWLIILSVLQGVNIVLLILIWWTMGAL